MHCSEDQIELIQTTLQCRVSSFPCKYLGVLLSIYRLRKNDELPLVEAVATRIPNWKGGMLNLAGRTTLTALVTLSAIPVHLSMGSRGHRQAKERLPHGSSAHRLYWKLGYYSSGHAASA
jgi:hypothetical protein